METRKLPDKIDRLYCLTRNIPKKSNKKNGSVGIGWGIVQQNGSTGFELLPSVKPTFDWIRLAQRIPVMVRTEKVPDNITLRAGTTASVVVVTGASTDRDRVLPVPRVLQ